jgi:dTDP-4-dehydrorhamnose 3,5-epimerase
MEIINLSLPGLKLIRLNVLDDERGFFKECYRKPRYNDYGIECEFVQDNLSFSKKGVIRGMHYQSEPGQAKLVSALQGEIFDVAVDIRPDSPYFGKWEGVYLNADKHEQLFIPIGFAHGFCVVSDKGAYVHYKVSTVYTPSTEKTFRFDDPHINIEWPTQRPPVISTRDQTSPYFKEIFS